MSYSLSNIQAQRIIVDHPGPGGRVYREATGINFTYHVTNQDGSIDAITRIGAVNKRWGKRWYQNKDPIFVVTQCEQMDRGLIARRGHLVPVVSRVCIKASDMEIRLNTQQQIISSLQQTINQLNTQIQNLLQNIQTLRASNADLRAQQATFQQQINQLQAQVAAKEAEVATIPGLKEQVESQKIQINTLIALIQLIF